MTLEQTKSESRAVIFNKLAEVIAVGRHDVSTFHPQESWVEFDANEIWESQLSAAKSALEIANLEGENIAAIGISSQRETIILWDAKTGEPIYYAIGASDTRCGHSVPASKIKWILDHVPSARDKALAGELRFGTVDTWLLWKLTKGEVHLTDTSNSSRTGLCNVVKEEWNAHLLERFDIPASLMPDIRYSSNIYGTCAAEFFGAEIPICSLVGIQNATFFGQTCWDIGKLIGILDKECNIIVHTGVEPIFSRHGLCTTVSYGISGRPKYALEGETITGVTIDENLNADQCTNIAKQVHEILNAMEADLGVKPEVLNISGALREHDALLQEIADAIGIPVIRPVCKEISALGAAYMAGVCVGYWTGRDDIIPNWKIEHSFEPRS